MAPTFSKYFRGCTIGPAAFTGFFLANQRTKPKQKHQETLHLTKLRHLPTRKEQLEALQSGEEYDVLVIGGGPVACACALDATTRGLKTALVEAGDFGVGTKGRNTKLIHGGVRYLQRALLSGDLIHCKVIREALAERKHLVSVAPHLAETLPLMVPAYSFMHVPFFWIKLKMFDLLSGKLGVKRSHFISREKARQLFPTLVKRNLKGAMIFYDTQVNDARVNLALAQTASRHGASVANYVKVVALHKDSEGKVSGARLRDEAGSGKEWRVKTKCVINAPGPFNKLIRRMDNPNIIQYGAANPGVRILVPENHHPRFIGLIQEKTHELFSLPWEEIPIGGNFDASYKDKEYPPPSERDIYYIYSELQQFLLPDMDTYATIEVCWQGLRHFWSKPKKPMAKNHLIHVSRSGLVTVVGIKWTTFRVMASDTVDQAVIYNNLTPVHKTARTRGVYLEGGQDWSPNMFVSLAQNFGLESEVALHLNNTYGSQAYAVAELAQQTGECFPVAGIRLHPDFPYIGAEVRYAVRSEYACTAIDVLARRTRLAFLSTKAAKEALPAIIGIMAEELGWDRAKRQAQLEAAQAYLKRPLDRRPRYADFYRVIKPIDLSKTNILKNVDELKRLDDDVKGFCHHKQFQESTSNEST